MTPDELANEIREARLARSAGGEQFLAQLVELAERADKIGALVDAAERALDNENADRQFVLEVLIQEIRRVLSGE